MSVSCYSSAVEYGETLPKDVAILNSTTDFQDCQFSLPALIKDKVLKYCFPASESWLDLLQGLIFEIELQLKTAARQ